jgi:beta-glucosidase
VREGLITEAEIDTAVRRLLATKFKLGLLDPQARVPWSQTPMTIVDGPAHRALARQAAEESIVLLKNNGILPLPHDPGSMLLAGPTAASTAVLMGNYYGMSAQLVTFAEGLTERCAEGTRLVYRTGCPLSGPMAPGVNYTYSTAAENEVTIVVLGLDHTLEGEEGDAVASSVGGDRAAIELPPVQREFLRELRKHAKKLILVLTGGSALAIPEEHDLCDAVLQAWYPGCEGGRALAAVLFGDVAPSGKLPVTVPRSTADLPPFEDYAMRGRTYRFAEIEPLYPFGFGLGYTTLSYGALTLSAASLAAGQSLRATVALTNTGPRGARETVQCYLVPPRDWAHAPRAVLLDFKKISLAAGASVSVVFELPAESFAQVDASGRRVHHPGRYRVVIGSAAPSSRAEALGAPAPASADVQLVAPDAGLGAA